MKIYNKYLDQAVRTIDSVKPTSGFEKTKEFKKNLEIKKLEKQLGKKPTTQKLNKGGRVGLKRGTGLMKKKSNIKKIKETFGPKKGLGMQSVIYGLDKNPKITAADPKAKFIAAAKKKTKKRFV
jgi:hypothetical protein